MSEANDAAVIRARRIQNHPDVIRAKRLLINYFKVCWPAETHFFNDNRSEIEDIAGSIVDAAVDIAVMEMTETMKKDKSTPEWLNQALNEGDGVYRP